MCYYFPRIIHFKVVVVITSYSIHYTKLYELNSKPATLFYRLLHDIKGKVFAKISLDNLGSFPLPSTLNDYSIELAEKANSLLSKRTSIIKEIQLFIELLVNKFDSIQINTKLSYNFV